MGVFQYTLSLIGGSERPACREMTPELGRVEPEDGAAGAAPAVSVGAVQADPLGAYAGAVESSDLTPYNTI
jgi:hypothetical protein